MMMNAGLGGGMNSVGTKVQHGTAHSAVQCSAVKWLMIEPVLPDGFGAEICQTVGEFHYHAANQFCADMQFSC